MDLSLTPDQIALREALSELFGKWSPCERVRAAEPLGFDPDLWGQLKAVGLHAMTVPERHGGAGGSWVDAALAVEEFGRWIPAAPLVEAMAANDLLLRAATEGSDEAAALLESSVNGDILCTLALRPATDRLARLVPGGAVADVMLAIEGDHLYATERVGAATPAQGLLPNLGGAPVSDRRLEPAVRLASGPGALAAHRHAVGTWQMLMANALAGLAASALELGVTYVKERKAFGVPISWFQSVQHRLADIATDIDGANLLAYEAAWARDEGLDNAAALSSMAFLWSSRTAFEAADWSLHFHGGYGYTLEYDIQLFFRRAKAWPLALGDPSREYRRLAHLLFEGPC